MSEIPEGATHVNTVSGQFFKFVDGKMFAYLDDWYSTEWCGIRDAHTVGIAVTPTPRIAAHEFLERGVKHMRDRAVQRDSDTGERSMARAVAAFNAQEGTNLTEAQGWRFMIQLKYARAVNGVFVADDYEDMAAYAGLAGEAAQ